MKKEIKFEVTMTAKDLSKFMIYHTYSRFTGIFGVCISIAALILLIMNIDDGTTTKNMLLLFIFLLYMVINPSYLKLRGMAQARTNPAFKKPLLYVLNEEGIKVSQGEVTQELEWKDVNRVKVSVNYIFVYQSKIHAFIFPKRCLEGQTEEVLQYLKEKVK